MKAAELIRIYHNHILLMTVLDSEFATPIGILRGGIQYFYASIGWESSVHRAQIWYININVDVINSWTAYVSWFVVGSKWGTPKVIRLSSAATRGSRAKEKADGHRKHKISTRTMMRPHTKSDHKLQQWMQICCGELKYMPMCTLWPVKCRRDVKTQQYLALSGFGSCQISPNGLPCFGLGNDWHLIIRVSVSAVNAFIF